MIASSSRSRNSRGFGLPGCACQVTVPTSTNPNPSAAHAGSARPSLSSPAARPTGLGNLMPNTVRGLFWLRANLASGLKRAMTLSVVSWTRSASPPCMLNNALRTTCL
jgi:hypothetical protein